ncbi:MAG: DUF58 domain-containing protein [Verrucomicrobiota bacterium]|nr:DUF58 domain-containing protein [Verrucomicrobiota bacterium]
MPINTDELMKQVRTIRIVTGRLVDEFLSGEYHSVFKGQGIEFDEVREYVSGDDIRSIDWNVTARMGHPFVKRFSEERELTVIFVVDVSGSQTFGSGARSKAEVAAEITCLLALSAIKNQDNVGLILFSHDIEKYIPAKKGRTAVMRLAREVLAFEETLHRTNIAAALRFLNKVQKKKAIVFLVSDFQDADFTRELRVTAKRHDVICCPVSDPRETALPDAGLLEVQDPETGRLFLLDTGSPAVREHFRVKAEEDRLQLRDMLRKLKVDTISLATDRPFVDEVRKLFHQRQIRAGRG